MAKKVDDALTDLVRGKISRRVFIARLAALGVAMPVIGSLLKASAALATESPFPVTGDMAEGSGGNLVVGQESNWDVLDPALGTGAVTWRTCLYQIYESLVSRDLDNPEGIGNGVVPRITKAIDQSSDGKTYTFHLQPGVTFTDGTPLDADAVMWNIERQWDQTKVGKTNAPQFDTTAAAVRGWFWDPAKLVNMTAPDKNTVVFELANPFSQFVSGMPEAGLGTMGISSPEVWKKSGTAGIAATPVGSGPFLFESQVPGDTLVIAKNPKYWNAAQAAKADKITFKALPDAATRIAALRAGEVHVIFAPPAQELASLKEAGFIVTARSNPHLWYKPQTMPAVARALVGDLSALAPSHAAYFRANARRFDRSLQPWLRSLSQFSTRHPGTSVASTEPVGDYMLEAAGIRNLTPFSLQADIMNGTDPAPQSISVQDGVFAKHLAKAVLYNEQVTDSLTQGFLDAARRAGIPVVGMYETMPTPGYDYQSWMMAELGALEKAVATKTSTPKL